MHDQESPPRSPNVIPRRQLLKGAALLAAGASPLVIPLRELAAQTPSIATPGASPVAALVPVSEYVPSSLRADEYAILQAAVDRIIPEDELGPGASEIGVQVYIDRALGTTKTGSLASYQTGLKALEVAAGAGGFAALTPDKQDALLTTAEADKLSDDSGGFFAMLLQDTREGMFCDPFHGGNANFAGWDLLGYPGIKLLWTEQDQGINATPKPEHISVANYKEAQS